MMTIMTDSKSFQTSVKGMHFDEQGKLLMVQEHDGIWELPGGRLEHGEQILDCLKRECQEETGLECHILDTKPHLVYSTISRSDIPIVMLFYRIRFRSFDFTPSNECVAMQFFSPSEIKSLNVIRQLEPLRDLL